MTMKIRQNKVKRIVGRKVALRAHREREREREIAR